MRTKVLEKESCRWLRVKGEFRRLGSPSGRTFDGPALAESKLCPSQDFGACEFRLGVPESFNLHYDFHFDRLGELRYCSEDHPIFAAGARLWSTCAALAFATHQKDIERLKNEKEGIGNGGGKHRSII